MPEGKQSIPQPFDNPLSLRQFVEAVPDAVVIVNRDGCITVVNTQTEQLFGYSREELLGQPLELLLPERFRKTHIQHRLQYFARPEVRPMGTGLPIVGRRKNGSEFPADVALSSLHTEDKDSLVISTIRDITAHKRIEAQLQEQKELLRITLASIGDAVLATDTSGVIIFVNPEAERLVGCSAQTLLGKNAEEILTFVNEQTHQILPSPIGQVLQGGQVVSLPDQAVLLTQQGREIPVNDITTPIRSQEGAHRGVVIVFRDFTAHKQAAEVLRVAKETAEAANRAKSEFLATMSHELRTPLNIIMGYTELLIEEEFGPLPEEEREILSKIKRTSFQLFELISAMLDLNRIDGGRFLAQSEEIYLPALLEQIQADIQGLQEQSGLTFAWGVEPDLPPLQSDKAKLKIVLKNLISNAVKFTEQGRVQITARLQNQGVELSVTDTGIGIPEDAFSAIFEPFHQLASQSARHNEGAGLGLHIVKRTLELLGGAITVKSEIGKGSTFRVWLPMQSPKAPHKSIGSIMEPDSLS